MILGVRAFQKYHQINFLFVLLQKFQIYSSTRKINENILLSAFPSIIVLTFYSSCRWSLVAPPPPSVSSCHSARRRHLLQYQYQEYWRRDINQVNMYEWMSSYYFKNTKQSKKILRFSQDLTRRQSKGASHYYYFYY